jgi:hypothetical protein
MITPRGAEADERGIALEGRGEGAIASGVLFESAKVERVRKVGEKTGESATDAVCERRPGAVLGVLAFANVFVREANVLEGAFGVGRPAGERRGEDGR